MDRCFTCVSLGCSGIVFWFIIRFLQRSAWVLHWHMGVAVACDDVVYAAILTAYSFTMVLTG